MRSEDVPDRVLSPHTVSRSAEGTENLVRTDKVWGCPPTSCPGSPTDTPAKTLPEVEDPFDREDRGVSVYHPPRDRTH